jgi:putative flippase GtrA
MMPKNIEKRKFFGCSGGGNLLSEISSLRQRFWTDASLFQPLRFVLVGGTTFVIYFVLQFLLERMALGPYLALTIAYAIAIIYHFLMNRYFTFRSNAVDGGIVAMLPRYAGLVLLNYAAALIFVKVAISAGFQTQLGMPMAIGLTTIVTYFFAKAVIFRPVRRCSESRKLDGFG